jgi:hypothetical protein
MSNIITQLILFKRYTHDNQNTQYEAINNQLADKRAKLNARIAAHNKKVAENKANEKQHKSNRIINNTVINNNVNMF